MGKMKGLGRGLDALLGGQEDSPPQGDALQTLDTDFLQPGKYQPRTQMDQESLAQLAESIKAQGIIQPILVRKIDDSHYEIIAGERRWRAARLAGLGEVPALVREIPDEAALAISLIENIQRENLNPLEEATGIQRLINEFHMTHQGAAEAVGRSRSGVSNLLRLLNLAPPVQEMLLANRIDMGHARALVTLAAGQQAEAAHAIAGKGLSVREAEKLVQRLQTPPRAPGRERRLDPDIARLQGELSERMGTKIHIQAGKKGRGRLVIEYASLDHLDSLLQLF
ncbi:MAG TPA: chromosome partitioning protein ParB [Betaproteobacteria bacterium]|nr:chromosome partitioning protein ParB [Betaproteobacteria bacterium]